MTADTSQDDYRDFLDRQEVATLRDWALHVAREHKDVGFLWDLTKHLPATEDLNRDWALLDPFDAIRDLGRLLTDFRHEAADPEVADLLRVRYVEYLLDHASQHRFDLEAHGQGSGSHGGG
jgi:hypothetical protein